MSMVMPMVVAVIVVVRMGTLMVVSVDPVGPVAMKEVRMIVPLRHHPFEKIR